MHKPILSLVHSHVVRNDIFKGSWRLFASFPSPAFQPPHPSPFYLHLHFIPQDSPIYPLLFPLHTTRGNISSMKILGYLVQLTEPRRCQGINCPTPHQILMRNTLFLVFVTILNFLIPIPLQLDGVNLWYIILRLIHLTEVIVWNIYF